MGFIILSKGFIILSVWVKAWVMCQIRVMALKYLYVCLSVLWSFLSFVRPSFSSSVREFIGPTVHPSVNPPSVSLFVCGLYLRECMCVSLFSVSLSVWQSGLSTCRWVYQYACLSVRPSVLLCRYVRLSFCLSIRLSFHPSVLHLPVRLSICPYVRLHTYGSNCSHGWVSDGGTGGPKSRPAKQRIGREFEILTDI